MTPGPRHERSTQYLRTVGSRGGGAVERRIEEAASREDLPLASKPPLAYTLEEAPIGGIFKRMVVSTEDERIAEVAMGFSTEVHMRNRALAEDQSPEL